MLTVAFFRSYGVLLWEIGTFGLLPLEGKGLLEIKEMAREQSIQHSWSVNYVIN